MRTIKSPSDLDVFIGQRIRSARTAKGISQEVLGEKLGLTFQQVQKYEKGTNRISAGRLEQIAQVLGCPLLWLYGKDEDAGTVPTPNQLLAERIGQLEPAQRAALEQMTKAMLEAAALIDVPPVSPVILAQAPKRGRPRKASH